MVLSSALSIAQEILHHPPTYVTYVNKCAPSSTELIISSHVIQDLEENLLFPCPVFDFPTYVFNEVQSLPKMLPPWL